MAYKFLEHKADIKIRVEGKNIKEVFKDSAFALREVITDEKSLFNKEGRIKKIIEITSGDTRGVLYRFLEEFLFLLDAEDFLFSSFEYFDIKDNKLKAVIFGDKFSPMKISNKVKAVTYYKMKIGEENDKFIAEFVLDV
jgi:SHS2 domain-containing protein